MVTIINKPGNNNEPSGGMWGYLGILLVIVVIIILLFYGIPILRNAVRNTGTPQINVPGNVNVNINTPSNNY